MEENKVKEITQRTFSMMKQDSRFRIIEGKDLLMVDKKKKVIDKYEMERRLLCGSLTPQDLHVMRFLAMLTYTDVDMLTFVARRFLKEHTEMPIVLDKDVIRSILNKLYNLFLIAIKEHVKVVSYDDVPEEGSPRLYCLTDFGLSILRKQTDYRGFAEEQMTLFGQTDIFRRVSANYVGCFLQKLLPEWKLSTCRVEKLSSKGKGKLIYAKVENDDISILVEPVFFSYVTTIMVEEDINEFEKSRLEIIRAWCQSTVKKKYIVVVVEGYSSLMRALKFIKSSGLNDDISIEAIFYTSVPAVIYNDITEGASIENAFLKEYKSATEGKIKINAMTENPFI